MATFELVFEFYIPSTASVEIVADSLADAMAEAAEIDTDDLDYDSCYDGSTSTRLYCVNDDRGNTLAEVDLSGKHEDLGWAEACLLDQWQCEATLRRFRGGGQDNEIARRP